jgi:signal transduction histidine kinase
MKPTQNSAERVAAGVGTLIAAYALVVLIGGWLLNVERLRAPIAQWSAMAPISALLLILLGVSIVWFERRRTAANVVLLIVGLLAFAALAEVLWDFSLGVRGVTGAVARLHRLGQLELPDPDTCLGVLMLVLALTCLRSRYRDLHDFADVLAAVVGIVCLQVLIASAYNIVFTGEIRGFRQIAGHTTLSMLFLAFAVTARRPTPGIFTAMTGAAQSASLLRRLLPTTMLFCLIIGWLQVLAVRENIGVNAPDRLAWMVTAIIVLVSLTLFVTSAELRRAEATVTRRQEELLAAKGEAEAASEAKSRFMAVMSHELRTPLTAMIGYTDLLGGGVAGDLSTDARSYLQRIRGSGWHLAGLIDAVLLYAGEQMPADDGRIVRINVVSLLRDVVQMFEAQARDKSLTLALEADADEVFVNAQERKLRQILINLIANAIKFTEEGRVIAHVRATQERVAIQIADTGIGIGKAHLKRIWEPFHMADASHTRTQGGMGLGLALTRLLTEQIGGHISLQSKFGSGTTVTLELARVSAPEITRIQLNGTRILVVDDEDAVLRIMARTLARYGGQVSQAESGQQALERVSDNGSFDVVVTDISMPGMTGIEFAQALSEQGYPAPILFVTGAELNTDETAAVNSLGGNLLKKPFDMAELGKRVQLLVPAGR